MSSLLDIEPETRDTHDNNELLSFTDDVLLSNYMDVEEFGENIISEYDNDEFLKIMHFNVDNLTTKFDALSTLVTQQLKGKKDPFFDLIAVSETHLRAEKSVHNACSLSEDEVMLSLDGYGFKGKSRISTKKGGVGFFVKQKISWLKTVENSRAKPPSTSEIDLQKEFMERWLLNQRTLTKD